MIQKCQLFSNDLSSPAVSKRILNIFQLSQLMIKLINDSNSVYKEPCVLKVKEKVKINEILNICFNLLHLKYSKYKLENETFFLTLPKYNSTQVQQLQHWYSKCNSK